MTGDDGGDGGLDGSRRGRRRKRFDVALVDDRYYRWIVEATLGLENTPSRTSQDERDAIAAAVTARDYTRGHVEAFGEIIVPVRAPGGDARQ